MLKDEMITRTLRSRRILSVDALVHIKGHRDADGDSTAEQKEDEDEQ